VTAQSLGGREVAARLRAVAAEAVATCGAAGINARLAIVRATREESASWYVRTLSAAAARLKIESDARELPPNATAREIAAVLGTLSADAAVHGIVLSTPVPPGLALNELASAIDPVKDVDGASPLSLGRLMAELPTFPPATAQAAIELLDYHGVELDGRRAVAVGRSLVVGKPVAQLLLARNATVTMCHSHTRDLASVTRSADVLVVAIGQPRFITAEHVGPGAVVVDVGTNTGADGSLVGDVDAASVANIAGGLSPVPGGVGPVTTARLLLNTATAATAARG
jgi:methylenetetrahydrofolate dehydrogenase (NADP+) / methenyltetrahydrofolate cyclohydrolase